MLTLRAVPCQNPGVNATLSGICEFAGKNQIDSLVIPPKTWEKFTKTA
jgi:hypothetical protein